MFNRIVIYLSIFFSLSTERTEDLMGGYHLFASELYAQNPILIIESTYIIDTSVCLDVNTMFLHFKTAFALFLYDNLTRWINDYPINLIYIYIYMSSPVEFISTSLVLFFL
ncbi:unnamed protein product [Phytomonas sp. Hart1]|nr:unnamed protein product [Phytomonas sp. Hart1]|eukprot:CCW68795.1 unnamed protein product [Phytomonas sp. isolate Hart1]